MIGPPLVSGLLAQDYFAAKKMGLFEPQWKRYYCWFPRKIDGKWVWRKWVERAHVYIWLESDYRWIYREGGRDERI